MSLFLLCSILLFQAGDAQFPPPREGITTVRSKHHEGITISYKQPGICETTPGVKSYSGYLHLPPNSLTEDGEDQSYPINTFFWFFESRKDPHNAPLSIWLNGGPGGSSLLGLLSENGPCFVNDDSNSTILNPWSWNNEVNMLYIDQPVQVGYSYDTLHNGTRNIGESNGDFGDENPITLHDFSDGDVPEQNNTFQVGTFASQNMNFTANTTRHAAVALWHFAQTWFEEFPMYKPHDEKINLWTESYGGHYGPSFVDFFAIQNDKITNGSLSGSGLHYLHLDTLGIINGCIDEVPGSQGYVEMPWNNTYGIQAVNSSFHSKQLHDLNRPGGIIDQIRRCQNLARELDPDGHGDNDIVNQACQGKLSDSNSTIEEVTVLPYMASGKYGWFDITHPSADAFPTNYHLGFLNQHWVQRALGTPVNHTWAAVPVGMVFGRSGDMLRGGQLEALADLLDHHHVKVALMYGDRDFACNWLGGESTSLSIPYSHQSDFASAGYTPLTVSSPSPFEPPFVSHGMTRQHGNLSFTRVYQAGHMVPSYQPEASYKIFTRALFNRDIATGTVDLTETGSYHNHNDKEFFKTKGPHSTWHLLNEVFPAPEPECYIFNLMSCTSEALQALKEDRVVVKDFRVVEILKTGAGGGTTSPPNDADEEERMNRGGEGGRYRHHYHQQQEVLSKGEEGVL